VIRNLDTAPGSPYHRGEKVAALTFDDGPSPVYTRQILRILAAARVPASFEIIGLLGAAYPGIMRAENAAGMALVNHTWTHAGLALLPAGDGQPGSTGPAGRCAASPATPSGAGGRRTAWAIVRCMPSYARAAWPSSSGTSTRRTT